MEGWVGLVQALRAARFVNALAAPFLSGPRAGYVARVSRENLPERIAVSGDALDRTLVHSLGPNVEPVLFKLCISHRSVFSPLFIFQPAFDPLAEFAILIKRHARRVHVNRCAHVFSLRY